MDTKTQELLNKTAEFDDLVLKFTDRCFGIMENLSREKIREELNSTEISLNSEEATAFTSITATFDKLATRLSKKNFTFLLQKLKKFAQTRILELALAGPMFASMVKGLAVVEPDSTLDFFIPYLCSRIEDILLDQSLYSKVNNHFLN